MNLLTCHSIRRPRMQARWLPHDQGPGVERDAVVEARERQGCVQVSQVAGRRSHATHGFLDRIWNLVRILGVDLIFWGDRNGLVDPLDETYERVKIHQQRVRLVQQLGSQWRTEPQKFIFFQSGFWIWCYSEKKLAAIKLAVNFFLVLLMGGYRLTSFSRQKIHSNHTQCRRIFRV